MNFKLQDPTFIHRLSQGDPVAYEQLFDRYYTKVCRFIEAIVSDSSAAEDLAQDVFMKIWATRHRIPDIQSLDSYLFTIAHNQTCDYLRRVQSKTKFAASELSNRDYSCEVQLNYDLERLENTVAKCVEEMPAQRQTVYRMSREEQLSNAEIAERLNLSKRTVDRHLSLALHDIRTALGQMVSGVALFLYSYWV